MNHSSRRNFVKKTVLTASTLASTGLLAACAGREKEKLNINVNFNKTYTWKIVTTWPPHYPTLGEGVDKFAALVEKLSGGRMKILVYGGGELAPPMEVFDAVSNGAVEMGHGAAYYWAGKSSAAQFFTSIPFGMNAQQMHSWIVSGGGMALWEEIYAPFGLKPFIGGNTGVQMGGWFNKEINSIADLAGLKMRIPGLGGKVLVKAGGTAISVAGGELYTNLERGVIDATEWIGPYHDYMMGFHEVAKYYYFPGWHEPGSVLEFIVNKAAYDALPTDLQAIIEAATYQIHQQIHLEADSKNAEYLEKIKAVKGLEIRNFPPDVLDTFRKYTREAITELTEKDPLSKKVYEAFDAYRKKIAEWSKISDEAFFKDIQ